MLEPDGRLLSAVPRRPVRTGGDRTSVGAAPAMPPRRARRARLTVQQLEARETPSDGPWTIETFDSASPGSTPAGWSSWGSDGDSGFRVADGRAVSGRSFVSTGGSVRAGRAWMNAAEPADLTATAAVFADSLIPAQVIARGHSLQTSQPAYYAASVVRGIEVKLLRVNHGNTTDLATVKSATYLSGVWLDLSLIARGDRLQVRIQRRDTGEWLNRFGGWQSAAAAALDARDSAITSPGQVGVARAGSYAGTVYFDEVHVGPAAVDLIAPVPFTVFRRLEPPVRPNTVAGRIRVEARVLDAGGIDRVEFFVDGALVSRRTVWPFSTDFETRNLANGTHYLTVRAWDAAGNVGEKKTSFEVYNRSS